MENRLLGITLARRAEPAKVGMAVLSRPGYNNKLFPDNPASNYKIHIPQM